MAVTRHLRPVAVGMVLALAATSTGAGAAASLPAGTQPAATLAAVSAAVDSSNQAGWWSPMDLDGPDQLYAFNRDVPPTPGSPSATEHEVVLDVQRGALTSSGCLPTGDGDGCARFLDDCGHRQPSVIIDGAGYLHAFVGMHNSPWGYFRSEQPWDPTTMVDRSGELPDQDGLITYPVVTRTPSGDLYLAARVRQVGSPVGGRLYRWDVVGRQWTSVATFAAQSYHWVYPDDLVADDAGRIHLLWQWSYGGAGGIRHLGSYLRYDPTTGAFSNAQGRAVPVPATTSSPVVYQPLSQGETAVGRSSGAAGIQSAKLAVVPGTSTPMIVYRLRTRDGGRFEVRRARPVGTKWTRDIVYAGTYDTFAALDITHDGESVRVYYAKKNTRTIAQAHVAEKGRSGGFVERALAPDLTIERLSVVMDGSGTDHLYLTDLTEPPRDPQDPASTEDPRCPGPPGTLYVGTLPR